MVETLPKSGRVVSEICEWTDRQTGVLITIFCITLGDERLNQCERCVYLRPRFQR